MIKQLLAYIFTLLLLLSSNSLGINISKFQGDIFSKIQAELKEEKKEEEGEGEGPYTPPDNGKPDSTTTAFLVRAIILLS